MRVVWLGLLSCMRIACAVGAGVEIGAGAYTQSFDGAAASLPPGWLASTNGIACTVMRTGTGSSATAGLYAFASGASGEERALGALASGTTTPVRWGVVFHNGTGSNVTSLAVAYVGEQWRSGGSAVPNTMACEYAVSATAIADLSQIPAWTPAPALDFVSPVTDAPARALDGNATANRAARATDLTLAAPLPDGAWLVLSWRDENDTGNDHGLGVDDVSLQWTGFAAPTAPEPVDRLMGFWQFNNVVANSILGIGTRAAPAAYPADGGAAVAQIDLWNGLLGNNDGAANSFGSFDGSTAGWPAELGGASAGGALAVIGVVNNGRYFEIRFDRSVAACTLGYATRGTSTGYLTHTFQTSTDGGATWQAAGSLTANRTSTFTVSQQSLGGTFARTYGPARNRIRVTVDGATSATGNNRFDNLQLRGAFPYAHLTLKCSPTAVGRAEGGGFQEIGAAVAIRATSTRSGWRFARWSDGDRQAERSVVVPADGLALTAVFVSEGTALILR